MKKETLKIKYHLIKNNNDKKKKTLEIIYGNSFLTQLSSIEEVEIIYGKTFINFSA